MSMRETIKLIESLRDNKIKEIREISRKEKEKIEDKLYKDRTEKYKSLYEKLRTSKTEFVDALKKNGDYNNWKRINISSLRECLNSDKIHRIADEATKKYDKKIEDISKMAEKVKTSVILKTAKNDIMLQEFLAALEKI